MISDEKPMKAFDPLGETQGMKRKAPCQKFDAI